MSLPSRGGTGRLSQLDSDLPACADRESPERTDRCHRPRVGDLHWPFDSRPGSPALTGQRVQAGSSKRGPRRGDHHGSVQCDTGQLRANPEAGRPGVARDDGRSGRAGADQEVSETGSREQNRKTKRCLRVTDAAVPLGQSRSSIHGTINPTGRPGRPGLHNQRRTRVPRRAVEEPLDGEVGPLAENAEPRCPGAQRRHHGDCRRAWVWSMRPLVSRRGAHVPCRSAVRNRHGARVVTGDVHRRRAEENLLQTR